MLPPAGFQPTLVKLPNIVFLSLGAQSAFFPLLTYAHFSPADPTMDMIAPQESSLVFHRSCLPISPLYFPSSFWVKRAEPVFFGGPPMTLY